MRTKTFFLLGLSLMIASAQCSAQDAQEAKVRVIDNFEKQGNTFGGRSSTYMQQPSGVVARRTGEVYYGDSGKSLELRYKKASLKAVLTVKADGAVITL